MSISSREMTILVQGLSYLIITISAARQFSRAPGQLRFHTLLVFGSATGSLILIEVGIRLYAAGSQNTAALFLLRLSAVCSLFALYAVFLLVGDLTHLRRWLGWLGIGLLILGGGFTLKIVSLFPSATIFISGVSVPLLLLVLFTLLGASFLFITIRFWWSSFRAGGAVRRRLQWLGAASTLACCCIALALGRFFVSEGQITLAVVQAALLVGASVTFYLGCAPPGWLRRWWMLPELEQASRFCNALILGQAEAPTGGVMQNQTTGAINQILQHSMNGFGALVGIVQLWNEERGALEVAASIIPSEEGFAADAKSAKNEALAEVFSSRQAVIRPISTRMWPFLERQLDAGMVMVAPLKRGAQTLGVLGVCCEHAPSLNEDDLQRLQLFADQITCLLTCHWYQGQLAAVTTLRNEQALKDEFIAVIAHDLRTPLTVLKGRLQLLRRQLTKEGHSDAAEAVAKLDTTFNRLSQLFSTLLDVSYIDTGRLQLLRHTVDLVGLVRKVVEDNPEREITLEVESAQPLIVQADTGRLEQVLSSLLDNARKYSPVESTITVRVARHTGAEGEEALVCIRDQGIGIPPEDQPHLFERWFRPGPAQGYSKPGLGLYISREIVTRHGGRLWVESGGINGEGSTFCFTLPLTHPQQGEAPDRQTQA